MRGLYSNCVDSIHENILINSKDIYWNKDKFENGEINLCFILGHSGSGKTSMGIDIGKKYGDDKCELIMMDDLMCAKDHFTLPQLKEYGGLIYGFFTGVGKKFYVSYDELVTDKVPGEEYEDKLYPEFVKYAKQYANTQKNKKFILEGVWLMDTDEHNKPYFKPEEFKDYAFYIKGTSSIVSKHRAAIRDAKWDNKKRFDIMKAYGKNFFFKKWKWYRRDEKNLNRFRKYFEDLIKKQEREGETK